jgi:hypothetical protein
MEGKQQNNVVYRREEYGRGVDEFSCKLEHHCAQFTFLTLGLFSEENKILIVL